MDHRLHSEVLFMVWTLRAPHLRGGSSISLIFVCVVLFFFLFFSEQHLFFKNNGTSCFPIGVSVYLRTLSLCPGDPTNSPIPDPTLTPPNAKI